MLHSSIFITCWSHPTTLPIYPMSWCGSYPERRKVSFNKRRSDPINVPRRGSGKALEYLTQLDPDPVNRNWDYVTKPAKRLHWFARVLSSSSSSSSSMENEAKKQPLVLSLIRFPFIPTFEPQFSDKYRSLKAWDMSVEERNILLTEHPESVEVEALICVATVSAPLETLNCLPSLRCVLSLSAGVDHIDLIECRRRGIVVCNAGTTYSEDAADFAVGLLIDVLRKISSADRFVRAGLWPLKGEYPLGSRLGGKRVGIVGLGSIGSSVAKRLETFGCIISYNSRNKKPYVPFPYYSNVHDLATYNDILIVCCELNKETFHIINTDVMSALGKEGVIVNVGRGALIDEKELVRHLVEGEIGGAGLDVFENEPDVPSELLELDNVVLTPHKSVLTPESFWSLHELVLSNLEAFFSNKPLLSLVKNE